LVRKVQSFLDELLDLLALILQCHALFDKVSLLPLVLGVRALDLFVILIESGDQRIDFGDHRRLLLLERLLPFTLTKGRFWLRHTSNSRSQAVLLSTLHTINIKLASRNLIHNLMINISLPFKILVLKRALKCIRILLCRCQLVIEANDPSSQIVELFLCVGNILLALLIIIDDLILQRFRKEAFQSINILFNSGQTLLVLSKQGVVVVPELLLIFCGDEVVLAGSHALVFDFKGVGEDAFGEGLSGLNTRADPGNFLPQKDHVSIIYVRNRVALRPISLKNSHRLLNLPLECFEPRLLRRQMLRQNLLLLLNFPDKVLALLDILIVERIVELPLVLRQLAGILLHAVDVFVHDTFESLVECDPVLMVLYELLELAGLTDHVHELLLLHR